MSRSPAWNRSVLVLVFAVAAYFQTWSDLWPYWEHKDATYTHGTLIALVAIWLVWRARGEMAAVPAVANPTVLPLVLVLSAAWLIAARANVFLLHAMLWPVLAFAALWAAVGWRAATKLAFPLALMYFAIPWWEVLKPSLQAITSFMVGILTSVTGIPAVADGPRIVLPDVTIYIALDCSGTHFLSVALAIGAIAGKFRGDTFRTRILIMALAGALSMIFNWLRILMIVLAYLNPGLRHSLETVGHLTFGWWVFALDIVVFYLVLRLVPMSAAPAALADEPATATPRQPDTRGTAMAVAASLLLPASSWAVQRAEEYPRSLEAPIELPGARGPLSPDLRWQPHSEGAAWEHRVAYLWKRGRVVELYRSEYHDQSQGKELISRGSPIFGTPEFAVKTSAELTLPGSTAALQVNRVEMTDRSGRPWVGLYTYIIGNDTIANARKAQVLTGLRSIYNLQASGLLAVSMPCLPDCTTATADLSEVMERAHLAYDGVRNAQR